jgi:ATP-binding cassette, subfamily A (ABC1), member 3
MYVIPIHRLVMRIVTERSNRSREMMKVMGMAEWSYWLSWFLYFMSICTIIAISAMLITKYQILPHSNIFLLFCYFWLYSLSLFGYSLFMSSLFSSPLIASLVSNFLYFFTHLCDYAVRSPYLAEYHKILASFLPSIAMKRAMVNILRYERSGRGFGYHNVSEIYYGYRVENCFYMFFVTFVLYSSLGIYLTNVLRLKHFDNDDAIALPWYYPF